MDAGSGVLGCQNINRGRGRTWVAWSEMGGGSGGGGGRGGGGGGGGG